MNTCPPYLPYEQTVEPPECKLQKFQPLFLDALCHRLVDPPYQFLQLEDQPLDSGLSEGIVILHQIGKEKCTVLLTDSSIRILVP